MSKAMEVQVPASELQAGDKIADGTDYLTVTEVYATGHDGIRVRCRDEERQMNYDFNEPVRIRKRP